MKLDDLINSTNTTVTTEGEAPDYSGNLGFDVVSAVEEEKKSAKETAREKLVNHLKERSNLRKAIRSGEKSTGNKDADNKTINTSTLADAFTEVMVGMGKDPQYMQETYGDSKGNLDLIKKMQGIQGGKFSGDIQSYMDGKNQDLTGLLNNMFPDYYKNKGAATPTVTVETEKKAEQPTGLTGDERSAWDKMVDKAVNFKWSDIGLESENRPIKGIANILGGFIDTTQKIIPGTMDILYSLTTTSPEKFNQYLDEGYYMQDGVKKNAKEAYDRAVKYQGYKGSYNNWIQDAKEGYARMYEINTSGTKDIDKSRGNFWFNTMNEESPEFKIGELGSEVAQQLALEGFLKHGIKRGGEAVKSIRGAKNLSKGTELATKGTELAVEGAKATTDTAKTMKESKNIAQKFIDWYNKTGIGQDIVKGGVEGRKAGAEFQLIGDVQNGQLSDVQTYGMNAAIASILGSTLGLLGGVGRNVVEPNEKIRTSLSRMGVEDIDSILDWSISAAKDGTLPSAKQRVTDFVVGEAKKNVKGKLDDVGNKLGNFRKNLGWSDLTLEGDFIDPINKALSDKNVGAKIIKQDGKYVVDGFPKGYSDILNKITDSLNSLEYSVKEKMSRAAAGEKVDFLSDVGMVEDLLSDLKGYSIVEKNPEIKQKFIEIEKSILDNIKKGMSSEQASEYEGYLNNYAKNKFKMKKVNELEGKMNMGNISEQPKMEDGQYLSDFLEELYTDKDISKNAKDMRIAAIFSDALYGVPLKPGESVPYPSKAGWLEEVQRWLTKLVRNPKSTTTGGWRKYGTNYKPSKTKTILKKATKEGKDVTIGKLSTGEGDLD